MPRLDLTSLRSALEQLKKGIAEADADPDNELSRDGVIQRFEYSHELALKFIKRILETRHGDPVDQLSFNDLLRTAGERGYITDVEAWFEYRKSRNESSHTYDANVAAIVFACAKPFLKSATTFLSRLEALHD